MTMLRSLAASGRSDDRPIDEAGFEALSAASVALLEPLIRLAPQQPACAVELRGPLQDFAIVAVANGLPCVARIATLIGERLDSSTVARSLDNPDADSGETLETLFARIVEFCAGDPDHNAAAQLLDALMQWSQMSEAQARGAGLSEVCLHADARRILAVMGEGTRPDEPLSPIAIRSESLMWLAQEAMTLCEELEALRRPPESLSVAVQPAVPAVADARLDAALRISRERIDAIANAAVAIGASALQTVLGHAQQALDAWPGRDALSQDRSFELLEALARRLSNYLASADRERATTLVALFGEPDWPGAIPGTLEHRLVEDLSEMQQQLDRAQQIRPPQVTPDDLSLQVPGDIEPAVLAQLLGELPALAGPFVSHLDRALAGSAPELAIALRIAHTLKGAALTAGVRGVATLTDLLEDALEAIARRPSALTGALQTELRRAAQCLLAMADALNGRGPVPVDALARCEMLGIRTAELSVMPVDPLLKLPQAWQGQSVERSDAVDPTDAAPTRPDAGPAVPAGSAMPGNGVMPPLCAVSAIAARLQRVVLQAARIAERQVELQINDADLRLDCSLIDAIVEPLSHLLRNAVDHGIEPQAVRLSRGKPPIGRLQLSFAQLGQLLEIRCTDDGGGLDLDAIERRARQAGMIGDGVEMTDSLAGALILKAGFSTRDMVSQLSGRGIGLDVVRDAIEAIDGQILVESRPGLGTEFRIRIPMRG
jgi:HPt (histidine-containing phosphotransfer) domain-containing protein